MKITIPAEVKSILTELENGGFKAYAVGGCVRDSLLGKKPHDWDITTSARPNEVKHTFRCGKTADTGIRYGTVSVIGENAVYEVTTFRSESGYDDFRHPTEIAFSDSLAEDLSRRDFTVNAIAADGCGALTDPFGGACDIKKRILRTVGKPQERFREDPLRILRGVRFEAQLGFASEAETAAAMNSLAPLLSHIAAERIKTETEKALCAEHFSAAVFEKFAPVMHCSLGVGLPLLQPQLVEKCGNNAALRWAALLLPLRERAAEVCRRLKFSNKLKRTVCFLCENFDRTDLNDDCCIKRLFARFGAENMLLLGELRRIALCDGEAEKTVEKIISENECCSLRDLAVNGSDLIAIGICDGRKIGSLLEQLLDAVLRGEIPNKKPLLLKAAASLAELAPKA